MHSRRLLGLLLLLAFVLAPLAGCWTSSEKSAPDVEEDEPFVLGNLIEPFDPPTLEELNKKVEWVDMPVRDAMQLLREKQAGEKPLVSVEKALQLRNTSPENNDKILSALGRLPKNKEQIDYNATIVRHASADVKSTNPILASSSIEFDVTGLTGFGLLGFDWNFNRFASQDTVVSWQESKDRMYDKVVMRDDLTWSDGEPITAHDVVFSWKAIMSEGVPVPAQRSSVQRLRWVEAYDDHTLVFFHKKPLAINSWNIGFSIIPKHIYEKSIYEDPTLSESPYHVKYERHPVSGNSYVITERAIGSEIVLERRKSWYMHDGKQVRDMPHFKTIRFRVITEPSVALLALEAGDLDEKVLTPEEWQTKTNDAGFYKNNTKAYGVEWTYFYFGWNNDPKYAPFFADKRVRKAMSYAFDHEEMLSKLRYGLNEPCNGIFHPTSRWAPDDPPAPYHRDIHKAEQLLEAAGWIDHDGDGIRDKKIDGRLVPFEFSILVKHDLNRIAICQLLKQNLRQIGIICNVRAMEFTVLQEKTRKHQFQATMGGWGTGSFPDTNQNIWKTDAGRNFVSYSNPKVDALFDKAAASLDPQEREKLFGKIDKILYEDQPYTWLYFRSSFYGFNKSLRGYNFSPRGPYGYGPGFGSIWKTVQ